MSKIINKRNTVEKSTKPYWPEGTRRLFQTLKEIPWISLSAINTLFGVLILFLYFKSIDHFPSDFSSLISLGVAASLCAAMLVVASAIGLFVPATFYQQYLSDEKTSSSAVKKFFTDYELVLLQLGGVGWVLLTVAYSEYRDCHIISRWYLLFGGVLLALGVVTLLRIVKHQGSWNRRLFRAYMAVLIALLASVPFVVLFAFKDLFTFPSVDSSLLLITFWVLLIVGNAVMATKLPGKAVVPAATFITALFLLIFSMVSNQAGLFPTMVATFIGIRVDGIQELRVSGKTCELIRAVLGRSEQKENNPCINLGWGEVRARVLSNVGERWLIDVDADQMEKSKDKSGVRLTIYGNEVQIVRPLLVRVESGKTTSCPKP